MSKIITIIFYVLILFFDIGYNQMVCVQNTFKTKNNLAEEAFGNSIEAKNIKQNNEVTNEKYSATSFKDFKQYKKKRATTV